MPKRTGRPLLTAIATGSFFALLLVKLYWLAPLALLLVTALFLLWTRDCGLKSDLVDLPVGHGTNLPHHYQTEQPPSYWAMAFTLTADATLFASLLFGSLFLWLSAPNWPPESAIPIDVTTSLIAGAALVMAAGFGRATFTGRTERNLCIVAFAYGVALLALGYFLINTHGEATQHAAVASIFAVKTYAILHIFIGLILSLFCLWRVRSGYVSVRRDLDLRLGRQWHLFTLTTGLIALAFPLVISLLAGGAGP